MFIVHSLNILLNIINRLSTKHRLGRLILTPLPLPLLPLFLYLSPPLVVSLTRTSLGVSRPPSPPPLFLAIWREGAESGPALFSALSLHCLRSAEPGPVIVFCSSSSSLVSRLLEWERSAAAVQGPFFALYPSLCLLFFPNSLSLSLYVCPSASLRTQFI